MDTIIKNAQIQGNKNLLDIAIKDGKIAHIAQNAHMAQSIYTEAGKIIDACGNLVIPPFVDSHFHLDSVLSLGQPWINKTGTLLEGISLWNALKKTPEFTVDNLKKRALEYCTWAISQGILGIRSHVDVCDDGLIAVEALLEVQKEIAPYLDVQLVAFPQDGYLRDPNAIVNLERALDRGVNAVGGIPHAERTMQEGADSIKMLLKVAEKRGLLVDMHCDESDDPMSRHIETLACETVRMGMQGRVSGSHLTAMHSYDNYYFEKLKSLMLDADMNVVSNPLINITLQGRSDSYPKRRGLTRLPELSDTGLNVSIAQDCIMDPWYSGGKADMLEAISMGYHTTHMTTHAQIESCFNMATVNPAKTLQLGGYGLEEGCNADLVILNASNVIEALRLKAERLIVMRRGEVVAQTAPAITTLNIKNKNEIINFKRK